MSAEAPQEIACVREGCHHTFRPKFGQVYHNAACARIAQKMRELAEAKERKERKNARRAESRRNGISEARILAGQIERYWQTVEDPTYYTGLRCQRYSTLMVVPQVTRARGKSLVTNRRTT